MTLFGRDFLLCWLTHIAVTVAITRQWLPTQKETLEDQEKDRPVCERDFLRIIIIIIIIINFITSARHKRFDGITYIDCARVSAIEVRMKTSLRQGEGKKKKKRERDQ